MTMEEQYREKMKEANALKQQIEASQIAGQAVWIDLRLRCLDLAIKSKGIGEDAIKLAVLYEEYVKNGRMEM